MSNSSQTNQGDIKRERRSSRTIGLRRVFVGDQGIRAGWSALLFIAIYLILSTLATAALGRFVSLEAKGPISPTLALLQESWHLLALLIATWGMARIEHRRFVSYNGIKLPDTNPQMTVEEVRDAYTAAYPEISTAAIEGPETVGEKMVYKFVRAIGAKG